MAFYDLKQALSTAPVLALPNFQQQFIIETDASKYGIEPSYNKMAIQLPTSVRLWHHNITHCPHMRRSLWHWCLGGEMKTLSVGPQIHH